MFTRSALCFAVAFAAISDVAFAQSRLPLKRPFTPTEAGITEEDLKSRIYVFADDSMGGRIVGSAHAMKAADIIAADLRRLGLRPAGDHDYFQDVPVGMQVLDSASTIKGSGRALVAGTDFYALAGPRHPGMSGRTEIIFMGAVTDTIGLPSPDEVRGKIIMVRAAAIPDPAAWQRTEGFRRYSATALAAAASIIINPGPLPPFGVRAAMGGSPYPAYMPVSTTPAPMQMVVTVDAARELLGTSSADIAKGTRVAADVSIQFNVTMRPARNVVAILPGSDARLRGQYVAIGAHLDGVGTRPSRVDHDSTRSFNQVARPQGQDGGQVRTTPDDVARIAAIRDSLGRAHAPRQDSINNGADDDASGSMGLLEIAEAMASAREKPRRSILFVWHTGEEAGLYGARHFTDNPTVPRDSIVAQLNIDMIGRGGVGDVTGSAVDGFLLRGGDGYLQLLGSRRLSTQLGDLVEQVNVDTRAGMRFDYSMDANGHPQNIYCRSDHYMYARYGIPIVFFTTGGHRDYHMVTDEPQYIDYPHLRRVTQFIHDVAVRVGNLDARPVVDKPKPDPRGACRQ